MGVGLDSGRVWGLHSRMFVLDFTCRKIHCSILCHTPPVSDIAASCRLSPPRRLHDHGAPTFGLHLSMCPHFDGDRLIYNSWPPQASTHSNPFSRRARVAVLRLTFPPRIFLEINNLPPRCILLPPPSLLPKSDRPGFIFRNPVKLSALGIMFPRTCGYPLTGPSHNFRTFLTSSCDVTFPLLFSFFAGFFAATFNPRNV